jgi:hypothetical protein
VQRLRALRGPDVLLRITCDVHSWMCVRRRRDASVYFAVSATDGSFRIDGG